MGTHTRLSFVVVGMLWTAVGAMAQEALPLLSGPSVRPSSVDGSAAPDGEMVGSVSQGPATLVERSFDGTLIELDVHPAAAALAKLALTDEERVATQRILDERARYAAKAARENQALLLKLQTARRGGGGAGDEGRRELMELMREARPVLEPLVSPTLVEKLSEALDAENGAELRRMVEEYMDERAELAMSTGVASGAGRSERLGARGAAARVEAGLALREIARAFATTVEMRREQTEALYRAIEATPEQEGKIQQILRDVGSEEGLGSPTPEKRREIMVRIAEILTPGQRALLRAHMLGE